MKSQFLIKEGKLEILEDRIEIGDKWKSARFQYNTLPVISLLYPLALVSYRKLHDDMWWIGLVLLIIGTLVLLFRLFYPKRRIFESQLQINQIDKVIFEKYSYDKLSAKFILKNKERRFVDLDFDKFWQADFEQALEAKGIVTERV
jgi:hypothetical protein